MVTYTSREFRSNQAACFKQADDGEQVVITRRGKTSYLLLPVSEADYIPSPTLEEKIRKAREEHELGQTRRFDSIDDMTNWLENL